MSAQTARRHRLGKAQRLQLRGYPVPTLHLARKTGCHGFQGDRFIPNRSAMDFEIARFNLLREINENSTSLLNVASPVKEEYKRKLAENLLHDSSALENSKILAFNKKSCSAHKSTDYPLQQVFLADLAETCVSKKHYRYIPQSPERILDAPELVDDYYLNLLDWSCKNVVAVALGTTVYLWDAESGGIEQLMQTSEEDDYITSVAWASDGKHISVGLNSTVIQIWDVNRGSQCVLIITSSQS
eukprot:c22863_g1_i1 orf=394-1122(+)